MLQTRKHLLGVERITFGTSAAARRGSVNGILFAAVVLGLIYQLSQTPKLLAFLLPLAAAGLGTLISLTNRNSLEINFARGIYFIETGSWPAVKMTGGSLSGISRIYLTRELHFSCFNHAAFLEFHPEAKREPYRLDLLPCSVSLRDYPERLALYLEIAERLNVPLYDDSGWNGTRPLIVDPEVIVVQPGEEHPVLKRAQEPKKWNKW